MKTLQEHPNACAWQRSRALTSARLLAAFAVAVVVAHAQTAPSSSSSTAAARAPQATTGDDTVTMSAYEVKGYSQSLAASLQAKRSADANVDVITAEDVGKFPDINLGESLSHLPGVTVDRLFGEGERVSILGTDPNLNRVLLNGEPISSADWYILDNQSRQFNYLLLAPDVIGQAEVYRTWEPRLLEGSIGGTVIVNTRTPLDMAPMVFAATVSDDYNDRSKKSEGSASAMFSWHNPEKTLGVMIGGQDEREYLRRDGVEALVLKDNTNLGVGGPVTGQPKGPWITDEVVNSAIFEQLRHRQGGNFAVQFKPNDRLTVDLTGLYVKQTMDNVNFSYYIYPGDNWSGLPSITNATVTNGVLGSYTINSAPLVIDAFNRAAQIVTQDYNAKVTYKSDDFSLVTDAGYTRAKGGTQHQFFAEYFVFANANINENASQATFSVTGVPGTDPTASNLNNGADFGASSQPSFDYGNIASNPEVDDEKWAQVDLSIPLKGGALKKLMVGLRFSDHKDGENGSVVSVPGALEVPTSLSAIGVSNAPSNYLSGLPGITPSMSGHVLLNSYGSIASFVGNLSAATLTGGKAGQTLLQYFDAQPPTDGAVFTATPTFTTDERINAAYLETGFSDGPVSGNFGARLVETTTTSASYNLSTPNTPTLMSVQNTYTNFLPALNLAYDLGREQLMRIGVSEVIARPNTAAEANYVQLYDSTLAGIGGNANLNPYKSTNLDLDYEWYFAKNSCFAVDVFYKDISNYIVNATKPEQWVDYSLTGNPTQTYEITRPSNGGDATSQGVALSYQQALVGGFGIQANYTRLHTTSATGPLPFSSKNQVNLSPYFENKWGMVRLTYSWRDDYLSSSFNGTGSVVTAPFTELDANMQINLPHNFSVSLSARNLLDETYRQYFQNPGGSSLFADAYKYGRTYTASVHWNY